MLVHVYYNAIVHDVQLLTLLEGLTKYLTSPLAAPDPPSGVTVVVTDVASALVSWNATQSLMCDIVIGNYSVRYRLRNGTGANTTVYSSSTSVTLRGLVPNAEYNVAVAAINSIGNMSAFSPMVQFNVTLSSKSNMFKYLNYYVRNGKCMIQSLKCTCIYKNTLLNDGLEIHCSKENVKITCMQHNLTWEM